MRVNSVILFVADPQVPEMRRVVKTATGVNCDSRLVIEWKRRWTHLRNKCYIWQTHIFHSVIDPNLTGNNVIHCKGDPQVKEMRTVATTATDVNSDSRLVIERKRWRIHLRKNMLNVVDLHFSQCERPTCKGFSVIHCVAHPQVKEVRSISQTVTGNRQTMPTEALHHIRFFQLL